MSIATKQEIKQFQNSESKAKAPKKKRKGWIIALIVLLLIIALPIAFLYIFFYDGAEPKAYDALDMETALRQKSVLAFDEKREEKEKAEFAFDEGDLSALLAKAMESVPEEAKRYFGGFDVDIQGNRYAFNVYLANLPVGFKSKAALETTLEEETDAYVFAIQNVKLGKIGLGAKNVGLLTKYLSDEALEEAFATNGIHIESSMAESKLIYPKENAKKDMAKILVGGDESLFGNLVSEFFALDLLSLGETEDSLSFRLDLSSVDSNPLFVTPEKEIELSKDLPSYRDQVTTLLNLPSSPFALGGNNDSNLMQYLIRGYSKVSDEIKEYVKGKDMSAIGITDPEAYEGKRYVSESTSIEALLEERKNSLLGDGIKVYENELTALFQSESLLGEGILLTARFADGYKSAFITFDNFYLNIFDGKVSFVLGLNVGGQEIPAILNFNAVDGTHMLDLQKDKFFLGEKEISENLSKSLMEMLSSSLEKESWITIDEESSSIHIDGLSSPIPGIQMKGSLKGGGLSDNGYICFEEKIAL